MDILIVETNLEVVEDIRLTLSRYLPDWHLSVIDSGKHCLNILNNGHYPDLVMLGHRLSDIYGLELLADIRDDSDLPVIFLSEDKDANILTKAFNNGANDYIAIPFNKIIFTANLMASARRRNWDLQVS